MRLYEEFDLNLGITGGISQMKVSPHIIEELVSKLTTKGYTVLKSSVYFMGLPHHIVITKDFKGPFASMFAVKIKDDFTDLMRNMGIANLFV